MHFFCSPDPHKQHHVHNLVFLEDVSRAAICGIHGALVVFRLTCVVCLCDHLLKPKRVAASSLHAEPLFGGVKEGYVVGGQTSKRLSEWQR